MKTQVISNKAKATSKVAVNINCPIRKKKEVKCKRVKRKKLIKRKQPIIKIPTIKLPNINVPLTVTGSDSTSTATSNAINNISTIDQRFEEILKRTSKQILSEKICEDFTLRCNSGAKVLWQAIGVCPIVTIKVENKSACNMVLSVHRSQDASASSQVILPDGVAIITADNLQKVEISCQGMANEECCGFFSLFIHIPLH